MFPLGHLEEVKQIDSSIYGVPEKIFVYRKPKAEKEKSKKVNSGKKKTVKSQPTKTEKAIKSKSTNKAVKGTVKGGKNVKKK